MTYKAQLDAPGYLPTSTPRRCENCIFFKGDPGGDYCNRFDFIADKDYACDAWQAQKPNEIPGYQYRKKMLAQAIKAILVLRSQVRVVKSPHNDNQDRLETHRRNRRPQSGRAASS